MPDYQQGKIYTIRCRTDDTMIYVGSTTQSLAKRWGGHKVASKKKTEQNFLIYKKINDNWDNWYIELYELYPCNCKEELCRKEGEIIRLIGTLNSRIEGRTKQEYRNDFKEELAKKQKIFRDDENNKVKIVKAKQLYYQENKEYINKQQREKYQEKKANKNNIVIY
jgi:hypothetical protein